ncbi:unnamed protein product, partial [Rotaria magnacalcarata]
VIAWLRICRPGSVIGPQQNYLEEKQAWIWSLGDAYRTKDRPRYTSTLGGNSTMDTSFQNPLRYSITNVIGDYNNIEEEKDDLITQGDRLNEIKARRIHHQYPTSSANMNVTSSLTCKHCMKLYKSLSILNKHIQSQHSRTTNQKNHNGHQSLMTCNKCINKNFSSKRSLQLHQSQTHSNNNSIVIDYKKDSLLEEEKTMKTIYAGLFIRPLSREYFSDDEQKPLLQMSNNQMNTNPINIYDVDESVAFTTVDLQRLVPSTSFTRAHTASTSAISTPMYSMPSTDISRSYAPMSTTSSNVLINTTTRKPRSYISSTSSMMKAPVYPPTGRYMHATTSNTNTTLTISDTDNRDPISSTIYKSTQRGKSPATTMSSTTLPTHTYYTRSKSSYSKY